MTWWAWVVLWAVLILGSGLWLYVLGRGVWRAGLLVMSSADAAQASVSALLGAPGPDRA